MRVAFQTACPPTPCMKGRWAKSLCRGILTLPPPPLFSPVSSFPLFLTNLSFSRSHPIERHTSKLFHATLPANCLLPHRPVPITHHTLNTRSWLLLGVQNRPLGRSTAPLPKRPQVRVIRGTQRVEVDSRCQVLAKTLVTGNLCKRPFGR